MASFGRVGAEFGTGLITEMMDAVEPHLEAAGESSVELRGRFTHDWKGPVPSFGFDVTRSLDNITVEVAIQAQGLAFMKWVWLKGTRVRYAQMTNPFQTKTMPDTIPSRPGKGGYSHLDTSRPWPGIADRRIKQTTAAVVTTQLERGAFAALLEALKQHGKARD